jgi:hypothetical protein
MPHKNKTQQKYRADNEVKENTTVIVIWTNDSLQEKGIHLYDQSLIKKIMIPYSEKRLTVTSNIYIHAATAGKQYEVIDDDPVIKQRITNALEHWFKQTYVEKEEPKTVWLEPEEPIKPVSYELDEDDWERPKKRGGMDKWA